MLIKCAGIGRFALCASLITTLTACSHSPSESDAKAVIKERLAGCNYLSLDSFDRVNGIAQGDSYYRVDVKYTLDIARPDEDLRDRFAEQAKMTDEIVSLTAKLNASRKRSMDAAAEFRKAHADEDFATVEAQFNEQDPGLKERDAMLQRQRELQETVQQNNAGVQFLQRIKSTCRGIEDAWMTTAYQVPMDAMLAGDGKMNFTESIAMVKTDNGWQASR